MSSPFGTVQGAATPVETVIARHTAMRAIYVAPPLVAVFGLIGGLEAAGASILGVGVVVGNFLVAGLMLSIAIRISLAMYQAVALFGFFLRLGLVLVTMLLIVSLVDLDRMAFGISAIVAYMVLLVLEAVSVARGRERELDWTR